MAIGPIAALSGLSGVAGLSGAGSIAQPSAGAISTDGTGFAASLAGAVDNVQQLQTNANDLALQAVTGNLDDISQATVAAARAQVTTELVAAIRNQGVSAFTEIMRMQA
ncbi:MAG: flagellar hook-basal body complex protein FliE [Microbacteriaceae bacterium]|nr:MAG: flagellar hook-basal body complex protein FliE [Microbacteriaceae bacterium]